MIGAPRSSPSAAARFDRSSRVVLQLMNASNRSSRASLPISSVLLPDPRRSGALFVGPWPSPRGWEFPCCYLGAIMEKRPNRTRLSPARGRLCSQRPQRYTPRTNRLLNAHSAKWRPEWWGHRSRRPACGRTRVRRRRRPVRSLLTAHHLHRLVSKEGERGA
jgi:hypothetical protein